MLSFEPKEKRTGELHAYLLSAVAPRPICFASTIDKNGNVNLSPFSFFNVFGSNPPIAIFSPARRVRDNSIKHTLENVLEVPEVVINMVNYNIVQQMSLSSIEYPKGVNEFIKSGLTPIPSDLIKPPRVAESPVQFECRVKEVKETGTEGGAGNLIICEIVKVHVQDAVLNEKGMIDQHKIDLVARAGGDWYVRASGNALFEVEKPNLKMGIGVDNIPASIRNSDILTGNDLGKLGNCERIPSEEECREFADSEGLEALCKEFGYSPGELGIHKHHFAHRLLELNRVNDAWMVLLRN